MRCSSTVCHPSEMVYKDYLIAYVLKAKARQRRLQSTQYDSSGLNTAAVFARPAHFDKSPADRSQPSSCPCCHRSSNSQHSQHSDVVAPDRLQPRQYPVPQQPPVRSDVVRLECAFQGDVAPPKTSHGSAQTTEADLLAASRYVRGSQHDSCTLAAGSMLFGLILFVCGSAPWLLPALYLLFAAVCLPWRAQQFYKHCQGFFLLDFCYVSAFKL